LPCADVKEEENASQREGKYMKKAIVLALVLVVATGATAAALAQPSRVNHTAAGGPSCKPAGIGFASVLSGPAAALGIDQEHWARVFLLYWNGGKPIVGVPKGLKRTKIVFREVGDSQLNPQVAATIGGQMVANKQVLALLGFVGSNETLGGGPVLDRAGMLYISSSATRDDLGSKLKDFYRVVPANIAQATLATSTLLKNGVIKKGDQAMVVDDAEAYAANQADDVQKLLTAAGVKVDRESTPASTSTATANFSAFANKAVAIHASVVFAPTQIASDSQLFSEQLKSAGYRGAFVAADGSFDPKSFNFPGGYMTYFGKDVNTVPVAKPYLATFTKLYGQTIGFGPTTFTALETIAVAISKSCADGKTSRAEVLKDIQSVSLSNSLLGLPIAFNNAADNNRSPKSGVTMFQIQSDGSYKQIASS
jgi:ABC-type branched-subunit amino acid transport system substrate-binding protein